MCIILACILFFCATIVFTAVKVSGGVIESGVTVVIDAGHGGIDGGVVGASGTKEAEINLDVAKKLKIQFEQRGFAVVMTRENKEGLYGIYSSGFKKRDMQKRKEIIEQANPLIVISIHMNRHSSPSTKGAQVFYDSQNEKGKILANYIQGQLNDNVSDKKRVEKSGDYYMVKCSEIPSVIVECGFLSCPQEEALLKTDEYQTKLSYYIFAGALKYLMIEEGVFPADFS